MYAYIQIPGFTGTESIISYLLINEFLAHRQRVLLFLLRTHDLVVFVHDVHRSRQLVVPGKGNIGQLRLPNWFHGFRLLLLPFAFRIVLDAAFVTRDAHTIPAVSTYARTYISTPIYACIHACIYIDYPSVTCLSLHLTSWANRNPRSIPGFHLLPLWVLLSSPLVVVVVGELHPEVAFRWVYTRSCARISNGSADTLRCHTTCTCSENTVSWHQVCCNAHKDDPLHQPRLWIGHWTVEQFVIETVFRGVTHFTCKVHSFVLGIDACGTRPHKFAPHRKGGNGVCTRNKDKGDNMNQRRMLIGSGSIHEGGVGQPAGQGEHGQRADAWPRPRLT